MPRGRREASASLWPEPANCADCHDGAIEERVEWAPPSAPRASNLKFTHSSHADKVLRAAPDSAIRCSACHTEPGTDPMQVREAVVRNCLDCHGIRAAHLEAPDTACVVCHVPLVQAVRLSRTDVSRFPAPPSHWAPEFGEGGHGEQARAGSRRRRGLLRHLSRARLLHRVSRQRSRGPGDPGARARSPIPGPPGGAPRTSQPHGSHVPVPSRGAGAARRPPSAPPATRRRAVSAATRPRPRWRWPCTPPGPAAARARGWSESAPTSHGIDFSDSHAELASARPQSCGACHARSQCLDCHRPNAADPSPGYHPAGFLTTHPAAAYTRDQSCADCHNQSQFCADCHVSAGLGSTDGLRGAGYHDAKANFLLNHGQAARQNLESCVSCHSERDCLSCHSAVGGRRFNPHGPGFDPETLRRKNPSMCTACHGTPIPGD